VLLAQGLLVMILGGIGYIVAFISSLAVGVKRLHDRDKSGWWIVLFYIVPSALIEIGAMIDPTRTTVGLMLALVALLIIIWAIVELGCLRGTRGPNRFGPDPLEGRPF
jgi:uncharacterized membrane protein YhaH (DUF805 family)